MPKYSRGLAPASVVTLSLWIAAGAVLGEQNTLRLDTGEHIYQTACVACHGSDGKVTPKAIAGFEQPDSFPDFTRCDQTTAELDNDYRAVNFCRESGWPRGELNLPRAIVTEKAYPEDEEVISTAVNARGGPAVETHVIHEQRFGQKNQIEVDVPIIFENRNHIWYGGIGDATIGIKRTIFSNLRRGSIFALQGSVLVPSGNRTRGFGSGTTTFETFAAYDQLFRTNTFIQTQFGADLPRHTDIAPQSIFFNAAIGQTIGADHGLGRAWSPMMEFLAQRDLDKSAKTNWDVLPQLQVTISHRQHIRGDLGVRVPVTNTFGRPIQLQLYFLWDWQDGKLTEGW
ncbi:MAG: cytochrome c, class I [Acidobacteria bacterium]|nr:MAG: cytochrome c, class I [Acidobacteriota bacterium]